MSALADFILEPLAFGFMQRAFLMSLVIGLVCAIFSCFLVLKGWSLLGDAVSHAVLPGLGLAYLFGLPLALGAFAAGLFCALGIGYIKGQCRVKEDAVMGIIFSGMFALGLILVSKIESEVHLLHVLFGNILGSSPRDLLESATLAGLAASVMLVKRKDLLLYCFDPIQAKIAGLPVRWLNFGLLSLLALTIVSALKAAGIILVIAMLIAPGATAFLLTRSFDRMLLVAIAVALSSCSFGTLLSFHLDTATAPLIVLLQSALFVLALLHSQLQKRA